jgi:hypothetical protein
VARRPALPFEAVIETLSLFDDDPQRARAELLSWMARTDSLGSTPPHEVPSDPAASLQLRPRSQPPPGGFDELLRVACTHYGLTVEALRSGSKRPRIARARAAVAYVAVIRLR